MADQEKPKSVIKPPPYLDAVALVVLIVFALIG